MVNEKIVINIDSKADLTGIKQTEKAIEGLQKSTSGFGSVMAKLFKGPKTLDSMLGDGNKGDILGNFIKDASKFESVMAKVGGKELFGGDAAVSNSVKMFSDMAEGQATTAAIGATSMDNLKESVFGYAKTAVNGFKKVGSAVKSGGGKLVNFAKNAKKSFGEFNHTGRRTYMSMISIMFLAQSVSSTFGGLIQNVLQMTGITQLLSAVLMSVFAPILPLIIGYLVNLAKWFIELPKDQKEMIAKTIMLVAAFATAVVAITQLALLFMALTSLGIGMVAVFGGLAVIAAGLFLVLVMGAEDSETAIIGVFAKIQEAIIGAFTWAGEQINVFFEKLRAINWNLVWSSFLDTISVVVSEALQLLWTAVENIFDLMMDIDWVQVWANLFAFTDDVINQAGAFLGDVWNKILEWVGSVDWESIWYSALAFSSTLGVKLITFLGDMFSGIGDWIKTVDWAIVWTKLFEMGTGVMTMIGTWIGNIVRELVEFDWIGVGISIMGAIIEGLSQLGGGLWDMIIGAVTGGYSGAASDGTRQFGGSISKTGTYLLHAGERVSSAQSTGYGGDSSMTNNITINANVSSDYDVRRLADQIERYWGGKYR